MKVVLLAVVLLLVVAGAVWALSMESGGTFGVVQGTSEEGRFQFLALPNHSQGGVPARWDRYLVDTATGDVWVWPDGRDRELVHVDRVDPTTSE
jgi:hypothetical protein